MAEKTLPYWDSDSPRLRLNLAKVSAIIKRDAVRRVVPKVASAKLWHKVIMTGLGVPRRAYVGRFRGERGLGRCGVHVDGVAGAAPWDVARQLDDFHYPYPHVVPAKSGTTGSK